MTREDVKALRVKLTDLLRNYGKPGHLTSIDYTTIDQCRQAVNWLETALELKDLYQEEIAKLRAVVITHEQTIKRLQKKRGD